MSSPSQSPSPSSSPECKPRPDKKHTSAHHEHGRSMSPSTCNHHHRDKQQRSPSPSSPLTHESHKCQWSHSRGCGLPDTGFWGAHPNLPFICHMGTCDACRAYGEHLTLVSFHRNTDFLKARQGLEDNLARLLDHSPTASWEWWCHKVDEHADRLCEENDTLQVMLVSLGSSQQPPPQPQGAGSSSHCGSIPTESSSRGRDQGIAPQSSSMSHRGEIPHITSSSHPKVPMPSQRDLFLTSSTPAPHEPTHIEGDIHMDVNLEQPALLHQEKHTWQYSTI